jgi:hypothetical protein
MNDATVAKALDIFTPVLDRLVADHGPHKGCAVFIEGMKAKGGHSAGQVAALIVAYVAAGHGLTSAKQLKVIADCATDPNPERLERLITGLASVA